MLRWGEMQTAREFELCLTFCLRSERNDDIVTIGTRRVLVALRDMRWNAYRRAAQLGR